MYRLYFNRESGVHTLPIQSLLRTKHMYLLYRSQAAPQYKTATSVGSAAQRDAFGEGTQLMTMLHIIIDIIIIIIIIIVMNLYVLS